VASNDPNGLDIFYLMLVATIIGFFTVFTVRGMAGNLELRHHVILGNASSGRGRFASVAAPAVCFSLPVAALRRDRYGAPQRH
jgi:hypothetical protein